jgi:hypothetical protein
MKWEKRGLIFRPSGEYEWMSHHACVPIADKVGDDVLRIYFGPRDRQGRTVTTFIEVEADDPAHVLRVHDRPVLSLGRLGAFDDSGAMPSCIVYHEGKRYLFYVGWNQGVTVPYRNAVGLAVSDDDGLTFRRVFEGPIVDRTRREPYFCASPWPSSSGRWKPGTPPRPASWSCAVGRSRYQVKYANPPTATNGRAERPA